MKLISSVGVRDVIEELVPEFEHASGHKVEIMFGTAVQMKAKVDGGEAFDLVILNPPQIDDIIQQGKGVADTRADLARTGMGFAIPAHAAKPDISTDEKLKTWLTGLKTIASGNPASGGFGAVYFDKLVQRLGIADMTRPKMKFAAPGEFAKPVAAGEAEAGVGLISEMVALQGVQAVLLNANDPASYVGFAGAVSSSAHQAEAGRALLKFLTTPDAKAAFRAKGSTTD
jgi:molybdate transport system substrate-binding protein